MPLLLGIDIGTSSIKAALFDPDKAQIVAVAAREYPIYKPAPDRAEQDADDWWRASVDVVRRVVADSGRDDVTGIGFSGQMHGGVFLDRSLQPVAPAIIWPDQRSVVEVDDLIALVGRERYAAIAGTLPAVGFMGPTLLWLSRHDPALLARIDRFVHPKDYVRLKMTGEAATDVSDAAASGLFDVGARRWATEIIRRAGLPESIFPPLLDSPQVAGTLRAEAAAELGLPAGITIVAGCSDQPAQAIGNGLIEPGRSAVTTGSGGQVFTPFRMEGLLKTDPRLHVFNHAAPGMGYVLGAILAAGLNLRWLRGITGLDGRADAYPTFSAEAADVAPGADGLIYLPYLSGERTPHMDPLARGAFIGLSYHHTRGHLARAVMEGVAFALRQALELSLALGGNAETIIVSGGGVESDVWRQIQADVFQRPLVQSVLKEQASVGAAILAGVGAGVYADLREACDHTARYGATTLPDQTHVERYNALYQEYGALYPKLRDDFHFLARFSV